jgi:SAM-dependent methyltransferase
VATFARSIPIGTKVLDAGAGDSPYKPLFAHCQYVSQDWTESAHPGASRADIVADLAELPVPDREFGAILCTEVLEHVADPEKVCGELFRVIRPGGDLLLTVPFVIELHEAPYDFYRYTSYGLVGLLEGAGFGQVCVDPLSGCFSTLGAVMRNAHGTLGTGAFASRFAGAVSWGLSELFRVAAPKLDRLDERRLLPTGWVVSAKRPSMNLDEGA